MSVLSILIIALALAADALAVAVSKGNAKTKLSLIKALELSLAFGLFQFLMPIFGFYLGSSFEKIISGFDHWIAFGLLFLIGIKMIFESFQKKKEGKSSLGLIEIFLLAVATSIDAFGVGISFAFLKTSIFPPAVIIGLVTFSLSLLGVNLGQSLNKFLRQKEELVGGVILILIGLKILLEHLT